MVESYSWSNFSTAGLFHHAFCSIHAARNCQSRQSGKVLSSAAQKLTFTASLSVKSFRAGGLGSGSITVALLKSLKPVLQLQ
jgi:hypothetical protein